MEPKETRIRGSYEAFYQHGEASRLHVRQDHRGYVSPEAMPGEVKIEVGMERISNITLEWIRRELPHLWEECSERCDYCEGTGWKISVRTGEPIVGVGCMICGGIGRRGVVPHQIENPQTVVALVEAWKEANPGRDWDPWQDVKPGSGMGFRVHGPHVVSAEETTAPKVEFRKFPRVHVTNPPRHGKRLAAYVLDGEEITPEGFSPTMALGPGGGGAITAETRLLEESTS